MERKDELVEKHILFFDFLENYYVSKDEVSKNPLNLIKKSSFVKEDIAVVRSSHPPLETFLVKCKRTKVKASPFKIVDEQTPVHSIIEQREKVNFKTSQAKTLEIVEKMLFDLKVKTKGTSTSVACTISRNEKEPIFEENTDSDSLSSVSVKKIFDDDLLENLFLCLLQKISIQNLLLLICSLKKDIFKPNFLFLLIKFMNGKLMVCLNRKSLIKWVICLWLELLI